MYTPTDIIKFMRHKYPCHIILMKKEEAFYIPRYRAPYKARANYDLRQERA